jgi:hypothetical protein
MKHVIDDFITFYETEAQATCAVLSELQKSLHSLGLEDLLIPDTDPSRQQTDEPTWADRVDRQIEETERHLQQHVCDRENGWTES